MIAVINIKAPHVWTVAPHDLRQFGMVAKLQLLKNCMEVKEVNGISGQLYLDLQLLQAASQ